MCSSIQNLLHGSQVIPGAEIDSWRLPDDLQCRLCNLSEDWAVLMCGRLDMGTDCILEEGWIAARHRNCLGYNPNSLYGHMRWSMTPGSRWGPEIL